MATITQGPGRIWSSGSWLRIKHGLSEITFERYSKWRCLTSLRIHLLGSPGSGSGMLCLTEPQVRRLRDWLTEWLDRKEGSKR